MKFSSGIFLLLLMLFSSCDQSNNSGGLSREDSTRIADSLKAVWEDSVFRAEEAKKKNQRKEKHTDLYCSFSYPIQCEKSRKQSSQLFEFRWAYFDTLPTENFAPGFRVEHNMLDFEQWKRFDLRLFINRLPKVYTQKGAQKIAVSDTSKTYAAIFYVDPDEKRYIAEYYFPLPTIKSYSRMQFVCHEQDRQRFDPEFAKIAASFKGVK